MNIEKCPCCHNHCSIDNLGCERGKEYFKNKNSSESESLEQIVVKDLKECGHLLHHNKKLTARELLFNFSKDELELIHKLLDKINHKYY